MSFSSQTKGELARVVPTKKCCMLAEITGFLRVAGSLRLVGGGKFTIVASTENPAIARHYKTLIREYFGSNAGIEVGNSQVPGKARGSYRYRYSLVIRPDEKSLQILRETGMILIKEGNDFLSDGIYQPIIRNKCCKKAYLRGLFLGVGTMSDPRKSYHLEFVLNSSQVAQELKRLIGSFVDLSAGLIERGEEHVVYMKRAEYISDMLGIMGANEAMLEFENIRIGRGLRREVNRISNCDNANVDRTLSAAEQQIKYIELIDAKLGLDNLDPVLRETAQLRLELPGASLTDIGEALRPPIKKPGVSKRFAKLKEIAESLDK
ncbi:DNA-binding protein WhiA [Mogibacterium timidum]|uniref:Probable cell division protein WhiA n=1 Tax=Mogibacterium timidum TaxID=35519 RepID=A0A7Y9B087_9FIRM|nr:DNA-binding protein WhiA [Mogibacterium timidum]NWO22833.1 DNA-binding protein WhiA [Mogibacterium timidum]